MKRGLILETLRPIVEGVIRDAGAYLIDMSYGGNVLRVLINKPEGVTIGECAKINVLIGRLLDDKGLADRPYTLEVSSPGLDRPLKTKEDFICASGRFVDMAYRKGSEIETKYGKVSEVEDDAIVLEDEGGSFRVSAGDIVKATVRIKI